MRVQKPGAGSRGWYAGAQQHTMPANAWTLDHSPSSVNTSSFFHPDSQSSAIAPCIRAQCILSGGPLTDCVVIERDADFNKADRTGQNA